MRIVVSEFMSLDGVVQAPGGAEEDTDGGFAHGGWSMRSFDEDAMGPVLAEVMERTKALLFGRRTWQIMAGAWPDRAGDDPFADRMNEIKKYVASRTLSQDDLGWNNSTLCPPTTSSGRSDGSRPTATATFRSWAARALRGRSSPRTSSTSTAS